MGKMEKRVVVANEDNAACINICLPAFDFELFEDFELVMDFLNCLSKDRNIFLDACRLEEGSVEISSIKSQIPGISRADRVVMCLSQLGVDVMHQNIFESLSVLVYIFEPCIGWEQFLSACEASNWKCLANSGHMVAKCSITCDGYELSFSIRNDHYAKANELLAELDRRGYKIQW